ncbi:RBBP9/YdeN family alpha/beta hydrolase [Pseudorhodoferax sp.]|uniref:RBBP9/YdeN family alpha/beta hydrolase n=1 Tax=Pseudorhodoferax sp. TaxID=1993553 RepID=UPI002DD6A15A|nr:alpha/beta hydrolase [Pseudorhodoferax sp.]
MDDPTYRACNPLGRPPVRLLIVPGLHDSEPGHWQSWLQALHRHAVRIRQTHWHEPDLDGWAGSIATTLQRAGPGPWIAVAHSFGVLGLVHHLAQQPDSPLRAALLVAPANPDRFGLGPRLPRHPLPIVSTTVLSETDPWMPSAIGTQWAERWGSHIVNLGDVGHVNVAAGFGSFPFARRWVAAVGQRLERERAPDRGALAEWAYAV